MTGLLLCQPVPSALASTVSSTINTKPQPPTCHCHEALSGWQYPRMRPLRSPKYSFFHSTITSPTRSQALRWDTEQGTILPLVAHSLVRESDVLFPSSPPSRSHCWPPFLCSFRMYILSNRQTTKQSDKCQEGAVESSVGENPQWSLEPLTKDISRRFSIEI